MSDPSGGWDTGPSRYKLDCFSWEISVHFLVMKQLKCAQFTINRVLSLQLQVDNMSRESVMHVRDYHALYEKQRGENCHGKETIRFGGRAARHLLLRILQVVLCLAGLKLV